MTDDSGAGNPLGAATERLERALARLEQRLAGAASPEGDTARADLAQALDTSRARERELEAAGAQASAALARAIGEIRAALGEIPE